MRQQRRRTRAAWVVAASAALAAALVAQTSPASSATVSATWIRQIGQPGHAGVYAWGMATATDGSILVSDYNNYVVRRYSTAGALVQTFSGKGSGPGRTLQPYGLAVDSTSGAIYLADLVNDRINKYNADGTYNSEIDYKAYGEGYTARLAVDSAGNVYAVSSSTSNKPPNRVFVYDQHGTYVKQLGADGTGDGQFGSVRGIAYGPDKNLYIVDAANGRIQVLDTNGNFVRKWGSFGTAPGQFSHDVRGLAIDAGRRWIYVSDANYGVVDKFALDGTYLGRLVLPSTTDQNPAPREVTVGRGGRVYVADYSFDQVDVFSTTGTLLSTIPAVAQLAPDGGLNQPEGVGVNNATGDVYVTDTFNQRVQQFSATGAFVRAWGYRGTQLDYGMGYPRGVAVDQRNGNVWVDDTRVAAIKEYTSDGVHMTTFGTQGSAPDQYFYSRGMWVGTDGKLYVPDGWNLRLKVVDQLGNPLLILPCGAKAASGGAPYFTLRGCSGVTTDSDGNIYAASPVENLVYKWDSAGNLLAKWGSSGSAAGQLNGPYGVAIDNGRLYVSEAFNNRISVFDLNGNFMATFGGGGTAHGRFTKPTAIVIDAAHHLFVTDTGNERIEEFQLG